MLREGWAAVLLRSLYIFRQLYLATDGKKSNIIALLMLYIVTLPNIYDMVALSKCLRYV